jgi:hypothetical protein
MSMPLTIRQRLRLDLSRFMGWDYPHAELARAFTNRLSNRMSCLLRCVFFCHPERSLRVSRSPERSRRGRISAKRWIFLLGERLSEIAPRRFFASLRMTRGRSHWLACLLLRFMRHDTSRGKQFDSEMYCLAISPTSVVESDLSGWRRINCVLAQHREHPCRCDAGEAGMY